MKSNIPTRQTADVHQTALFVHPDPKVGRPFAENIRAGLHRLLPDVRRAVPVRRAVGQGGGREAGAGRRHRPRRRTRSSSAAPTASARIVRIDERDLQSRRRARAVAAGRALLRHDPERHRPAARRRSSCPSTSRRSCRSQRPATATAGRAATATATSAFLNSETGLAPVLGRAADAGEAAGAIASSSNNYVRDQKKIGRFQRPLHTEVTSMPELIKRVRRRAAGDQVDERSCRCSSSSSAR